MDASKTGLRVKLPVFDKDRQQWGAKQPWYTWRLEQGKLGKGGKENTQKPFIKKQGSPFILDVLVKEGDNLRKEALYNYRRLKAQPAKEDQDLSKPWNVAKAKAIQAKASGIHGFLENLEDINTHVEEAWKEYQRAVAIYKSPPPEESLSRAKDALFEKVAHTFAKPPSFRGFVFYSDDDIQTLKASLASTKSLTFTFSVAFRDVCAIKTRAIGNVPVTHQFAQCVTIPNIVARTFAQVGADT